MIRMFAALCLLLFSSTPVLAQEDPRAQLTAGAPGRVVDVVDGDTLILDDGREIRLVGLQAPKLPLGRAGFKTWPLAPEAKAALERLALGRVLTPYVGGRAMDRHGRHLAHLFAEDGLWIQGEMLRQGLARVYTFADNRSVIAEMLALEKIARASHAGLWALDHYRILSPAEADQKLNTYQLIEGRVLDAATVRGTTYLNFGPDWRTDFTVTLKPAAKKLFLAAGLNPLNLKGRLIRARGWLNPKNGPEITATYPEQIEIIE